MRVIEEDGVEFLRSILVSQDLWGWMEQFAYQYGYFGVFIVSLIGSVSVIVPFPYTLVIYVLGAVLDPFLIAISGGVGAAIGEFSGYLLGYYGRTVVSEDQRRKMDFMLRMFSRYGSIAIFFFALTPLPDDLLFIPLGIMKYSFVKAFLPCILGKILMNFILAIAGRWSIGIVRVMFGGGGWWGTVITTAVLIVIIAVMLKVDWEKVFTEYIEKGQKKDKE